MANQSVSVFQFQQSFDVRVQVISGEPWFCLTDVCAVLDIQNSRDMVAKQLDSKGVDKIYTPTNGGNQQLTYVNEPNLYRVIFRSNKPDYLKISTQHTLCLANACGCLVYQC